MALLTTSSRSSVDREYFIFNIHLWKPVICLLSERERKIHLSGYVPLSNTFPYVCDSGLLMNSPCFSTDACLSSPCENGGTCTSNYTSGGFTCSCPSGYSGNTCADQAQSGNRIFYEYKYDLKDSGVTAVIATGSGKGAGRGGERVGGGPDPAFPLPFHDNPASRTFPIAIQHPGFSFPQNTLKTLMPANAN